MCLGVVGGVQMNEAMKLKPRAHINNMHDKEKVYKTYINNTIREYIPNVK